MQKTIQPIQKRRILLATFGSLGDLHPYLAIALELLKRGHEPVVATHGIYREKVEAMGLSFRAVRPDSPDFLDHPELMEAFMNIRTGPEMVMKRWIIPALRQSLEDTLAAAEGADLLVSHPLTYSVRLIAELQKKRWVSTVLAPMGFFSKQAAPPLLPGNFFAASPRLNHMVYRALYPVMKAVITSWHVPYRELRKELGLADIKEPIFEGQHSTNLVLALFSEALSRPEPDWPPQTRITGFPFLDHGDGELPVELKQFLDAGSPPLVFTLGSSAVFNAGDFYESSAAAASKLGRRAVLLTGLDQRNRSPKLMENSEVAVFEYAPYKELFARAAAIVHQGGIGTTAQAMRSGKPMLVMPFAFDQPDNAARVIRLGIARTLARRQYTPERVAKELEVLLGNPSYAERAEEIGTRVRNENGVEAACDALEALLR